MKSPRNPQRLNTLNLMFLYVSIFFRIYISTCSTKSLSIGTLIPFTKQNLGIPKPPVSSPRNQLCSSDHQWLSCCCKCSWFGWCLNRFQSTSTPPQVSRACSRRLSFCCHVDMLLLWTLGLAVYKFGTMIIQSWFMLIDRVFAIVPPSCASFRESWSRGIVCLPTNAKPHPSAAASASAHILPRQWGFCSQPENNMLLLGAREGQSSSNMDNINNALRIFNQFQLGIVRNVWKIMEMFDLLRPWPLSPPHFWQCPCRSQTLS